MTASYRRRAHSSTGKPVEFCLRPLKLARLIFNLSDLSLIAAGVTRPLQILLAYIIHKSYIKL